jgi:hypothetical protein
LTRLIQSLTLMTVIKNLGRHTKSNSRRHFAKPNCCLPYVYNDLHFIHIAPSPTVQQQMHLLFFWPQCPHLLCAPLLAPLPPGRCHSIILAPLPERERRRYPPRMVRTSACKRSKTVSSTSSPCSSMPVSSTSSSSVPPALPPPLPFPPSAADTAPSPHPTGGCGHTSDTEAEKLGAGSARRRAVVGSSSVAKSTSAGAELTYTILDSSCSAS